MKLFKLLQKMKSTRVFLWTSFAVGAVLSMIAQVHSEDDPSATPVVTVWRRYLDIYNILQGNKTEQFRCDIENALPTYLVKENQCIDNYYLFNGNLVAEMHDTN